MEQLFRSGTKLFQIGANCYLQVGQTVISKWSNYFKVGQKLFQIVAVISEWDITLIKRKTINPVNANKEAFRIVLNKGALKNISQNSKENTFARVSFLIRSHVCLHPY